MLFSPTFLIKFYRGYYVTKDDAKRKLGGEPLPHYLIAKGKIQKIGME
jgi:hypothetical protein